LRRSALSGELMRNDQIHNELGVVALPFCPVPPNLEVVLGYVRERRFVSFYWDNEDDTACMTDGDYAACGSGIVSPNGWDLYITHPVVAKALTGLKLYQCDPIEHAIILDREERKMYAAGVQDARNVLAGRYANTPVPDDVPREMFQLDMHAVDAMADVIAPDSSPSAVLARAEARRDAEQAMLDWLNRSGDPHRSTKENRAGT